ncbi:MAG: ABC transporter permease [Bacteroidales bacterium]|nr:ABC transporter permease [Bacteroidales bacterium]
MTQYIVRRLLLMPLTLIGVTLLIFGMLSFLSPAERVSLYVRDIPKNDIVMNSLIERYGLDDPFFTQYWRWMVGQKDAETGEWAGGILRGNFGYSRSANQNIVDLIKRRFPATVELALYSIVPLIGVGTWLGIVAAKNHDKLIDQITRLFGILGYSFPSFVFGLLMLMFFYAKYQIFPPDRLSNWAMLVVSGENFTSYTSLVTIDALLNGRFDIFLDALRHLVLPIITLSYINWALYLRIMRSSMLESMNQDYIVTARAKGVKEKDVLNKHARPNAMIPIVTMSGMTIAGLLSGVTITETIFIYPGIGSAAAAASTQLDVVTILSLVLLTGFILLIANLIVDITYAFLDPRVRLS